MAAPPSYEDVKKLHPYQKNGPVGSYEARQVFYGNPTSNIPGLYVRIDMPGVPDDGVTVVPKPTTRTINFTGRAPVVWPHVDGGGGGGRVYAGYVVLDREISQTQIETHVCYGCLRLFFPFCDGSVHFLSPNTRASNVAQPLSELDSADIDGDDDTVDFLEGLGERYISYIEHDSDSPGIRVRGGRPVHINPYLLSGVKGVYEHKVVDLGDGEQLVYVRLDVPGIGYDMYVINEAGPEICFAADGKVRVFPFDEQLRGFIGVLKSNCSCCQYELVDHDVKHGVLRFLVRKTKTGDLPLGMHYQEPPLVPGEAPKRMKSKFTDEFVMSVMKQCHCESK